MRKLLLLLLLFAVPAFASLYSERVLDQKGVPVQATVRVCTTTAVGSDGLCSSLATIYSNAGMSTTKSNPFSTASDGNFNFYQVGTFYLQVYGAGITTTAPREIYLPDVGTTVLDLQALNGVRFAERFSPIFSGAISDCPSAGCWFIDGGLTNPATITSDPFAGVSGSKHLDAQLGMVNYTTTAAWNLPENTWLHGHGPRSTTITVAANSIYALQSLHDAPGIQQLKISDLTIDAGLNSHSTTGTGGIHLTRVFQPSELSNLFIQDFEGVGILWDNYNINGGTMSNVEVLGDATGTANSGTCVVLNGTAQFSFRTLSTEFCNIGLQINNTHSSAIAAVTGSDFHYEFATGTTAQYAIDVAGNVAGVNIDGIYIYNAGTLTCGINLAYPSQAHKLTNIFFTGGGTYTTGKICLGGASSGFTGNFLPILTNGLTQTGTLNVTTGIGADKGGFKHKRVSSCTTAASIGAACDTTVTWGTAFADANYTVSCSISQITNEPEIVSLPTKTGSAVTVRIKALSALAASGTIECEAVHD